MTERLHPPIGEVEVSIFGPGKGESCAVHVGNGDWVVVDSCVNQRIGGNPVLQYFEEIGVDTTTRVKVIVATHAHDDHIAGIADLVNRCSRAEFVWPDAASREEFLTLLEADSEMSDYVRPSAYSQYRRVLDILEERAGGGRPKVKRALADRLLWRRDTEPKVQVVSLSPSDEAVTRALEYFAGLLKANETEKRRVSAGDPNTFAAALWVRVGDVRVLLGSDLLIGPGPNCGWNAVLGSATRPSGRSSLYKVAHHGSPTSHHEGIWSELLDSDPIAVLAPFRGSRTPRPSPEDEARIVGLSREAYATALTRAPAPPAAVRKTAALLGSVAARVREVDGTPGQVRARCAATGGSWDVTLFPPARRMDARRR